jgi:hypothetical protein
LRTASAGDPEPVGAGYYHARGIVLREARELTEANRSESVLIAIANEVFAKEFFPKGTAVGQRIKPNRADAKAPSLTVVGVLGNRCRPTLYLECTKRVSIYRPLR